MATKIVLKATTKMSLNERFGNIRKSAPVPTANVTSHFSQFDQPSMSSNRNRKLVQQMERRTSVIAALKLKRKSLHNRLGYVNGNNTRDRSSFQNIRSRLSLNRRFQGSFRGRGGRNNVLKRVQQGGVTGVRKGISPLLKGRLGMTSYRGNFQNGRGGKFRLNRHAYVQNNQTKKQVRNGKRVGNQGARRAWRGGRGRGKGVNNPVVAKQDLDNDIDAYMAKTKTSLDVDLDDYMSTTFS